jgi:hypothetical protein
VEERTASVLTLTLLASPLVLMLGFSFMSDVQFMAWLVIALWLYVRGLRRRSDAAIFLGSVAAACAIGTRQFGMALIAGVAIAWAFAPGRARLPLRSLVAALAAPIAMGAWQVSAGLTAPTFTQAVRLHEQAYYLSRPLPVMAHEIAWRLATIVQYLAMMMAPVLPALGLATLQRRAAGDTAREVARFRWRLVLGIACALAVLVAIWKHPSTMTARPAPDHAVPLFWMLPNAFRDHAAVLRGLGAIGLLGGAMLAALGLQALVPPRRWRRPAPEWTLCAAVGLSLLVLHMLYVQLNDTYLVGLLPFALLLAARLPSGAGEPSRRLGLAVATACCAVSLVATSLSMRGDYNEQEAEWRAAERLLAAGIDRRCVGGSRHWAEYHGAFDDWLAAVHPTFEHRRGDVSPAPPGPLHEPFYRWLHRRYWNASHQVAWTDEAEQPPGWRLVERVPYRDALFRRRTVRVHERLGDRPADAERCSGAAKAPRH